MAEQKHKRMRDKSGRVIGYKGTSKGIPEAEKLWETAEKDYRKAHKLPFTAQRKSYWDTSPGGGKPSFKAYFKKWKAKRAGKKKGQKAAVSGQAKTLAE